MENYLVHTHHSISPIQPRWRRISAAALLLCAVAGIPQPLLAADPPAGSAVMNFVGADIESVIKAVGQYTSMTFIIDPRVKGTISLVSEKPVTKAQAFSLLTSALRLQGYAVVIGEDFAKVVPEADAKLQAGPSQGLNVKGDQIATQIFRLNYESAANLVTVLRPLISPNNTINANPGNNSLVITDYADNLRRLGKIVASLDAPASGDVDIIPIRYAIASDLAQIVTRLLDSGATVGMADGGKISVLADSRTNSLVIRAPSLARANLAKSLIARLDQPTAQPGNVHVVYLRNADATKLAQTLRSVMTNDTSAPQQQSPMQSQQQSQQQQGFGQSQGGGMTGSSMQPLQQSGSLSNQSSSGGAGGSAAGFIQADATTNTLIITASEAVYRNLRVVIDQLDVRRAQIYIESLIVEVSAKKAAEFGIQWLGLSGNSNSNYRVGAASTFSTDNIAGLAAAAKAGTVPAVGAGLTLGVFRQINGALGLGALARALESDDGTNILSMPNLITLDNEEARIIVGQNVPFITGQYTTQASGGGSGVNPFQTVERKDVGLQLRVRPQVSEGGTVKMAIYQETSAVQSSTNTAGIITSKRSIDTNVLVDDGQIIVLGGLIEDTLEDGNERVPGLGDLPVVGNLFKYQKRNRTKTNLMVFLRPTIIRSNEQSLSLSGDRYDLMRKVQQQSQPAESLVLPNMTTPTLPVLENGMPGGGNMVRPIAPAMGLPPKVTPEPAPIQN
ncbi:type II secretion system secretin GspD [Actimicrobium sp. CCI2.3]|uniref:type II secretion system secretin GspD n=1 Tax=Actimicrobium sp. CCI2.3 TaxID=3048616 RepID=UPI002AB597BD|nr:type II secretion system secretin GspD [Actimicrobium sp. CCI2.3]MDY7576368.1 type II secretion system secretin GspD [Actimicrobium sp. CCI2.3]MEB0020428.1 type II secretion system secretin GspD [Actimicrobium sp. CCI2.3]